MRRSWTMCLSVAALLGGMAACSDDPETIIVTEYEVIETEKIVTETEIVEVDKVVEVDAACSATHPNGVCETAGETCFGGECVVASTLCSPTNPNGVCAEGLTCFTGGCVLTSGLCGAANPAGPCEVGSTCVEGTCVGTADLCSSINHDGLCPSDQVCQLGVCGEPEVDPCTVHVYTEQPELGVSTTHVDADKLAVMATNYSDWLAEDETRPTLADAPTIITVDGLQFKDLNRNGELDVYEDWRLNESCRAWDLVSQMTLEQKIGTMSEGSRFGGGTDDASLSGGTINTIVNLHRRYSLLRVSSRNAETMAHYHNNVQALAERQPLGIPATLTADPVHGFGMSTNAASGEQSVSASSVVSPWPYPAGLGAINDPQLTRRYGDVVRQEFRALGLHWQLGPMADLATEPRWARVQNTWGENAFHGAIHTRACIEGFQAVGDGGLRNGIAATMKHFPGAGPNEEGMDSHSYPGRYNVFPGDHFTYHQIPFQAAIDAGSAAVMPCYSIYKDQFDYNPEQVAAGVSYTLMTMLLKEEMGFDGMVTGDWGNLSKRYNQESMSNAQYSAMWLHAGSHQYGSDNESNFRDAYDEGLVDDWDIDQAVHKIVEMTFKLGLFENPYTDPAWSAEVARSEANLTDGFVAQKRAVIQLYRSGSSSTRPIPIDGSRAGIDYDADGTISVYYDGVADVLAGSDYMNPILGEYAYATPAGEGLLPVVHEPDIAAADIAIIRFTARKGVYFGLDAGVPLSLDGAFKGSSNDSTIASAIRDRDRIIDAMRVKYGYIDADGATVAATNPDLRIVLVMHFDRPGIVRPFIDGVNLDEPAGEPGGYPLVSDEANIGGAYSGNTVDGLFVEFGAIDRAVLDVLFNVNAPEDYPYSRARLPMEIPASDAAVEAQYEDVPADSLNPTFRLGAGINL